MAFNDATIRINQKDRAEKKVYKEEKKTMTERVEGILDKIPETIKHANMVAIAKQLIEDENLSSDRLLQKSEDELERMCNPYDPAVIIGIIRYFEVNKSELEKMI